MKLKLTNSKITYKKLSNNAKINIFNTFQITNNNKDKFSAIKKIKIIFMIETDD